LCAFFTRAYDFIRMGAVSGVDLRPAGSHAGIDCYSVKPVDAATLAAAANHTAGRIVVAEDHHPEILVS